MKSYLKRREAEQLEKPALCVRDRLLIRLFSRLGCREALALSVEDIDLDRGTATIQRVRMRVRLSCAYCNTRLTRKHRFCPGCGSVAEAVREEKEYHHSRTVALGANTVKMLSEYIDRGGPVTRGGKRLIIGIGRRRAWQILRQCAKKAGIDNV